MNLEEVKSTLKYNSGQKESINVTYGATRINKKCANIGTICSELDYIEDALKQANRHNRVEHGGNADALIMEETKKIVETTSFRLLCPPTEEPLKEVM